MNKEFIPLNLKGAFIIQPKEFRDARGFFMESYNKKDFEEGGINDNFVQDNYSFSVKHVLRGLHLQKKPYETSKLVQCVNGEIFDVLVDLRKESPSFGKWEGYVLSQENKKTLYVPKGFAHGFCILSDTATVIYKVDEYYHPGADLIIRWDDPNIGISWPVKDPILSEKDKNAPFLKEIVDFLS